MVLKLINLLFNVHVLQMYVLTEHFGNFKTWNTIYAL